MKQPPAGMPMTRKRPDLDRADRAILKDLAERHLCQQRIVTDLGHHYVYCGGYFKGKARKTRDGYRCRYHRVTKRRAVPTKKRKV